MNVLVLGGRICQYPLRLKQSIMYEGVSNAVVRRFLSMFGMVGTKTIPLSATKVNHFEAHRWSI